MYITFSTPITISKHNKIRVVSIKLVEYIGFRISHMTKNPHITVVYPFCRHIYYIFYDKDKETKEQNVGKRLAMVSE